MSLQVSMRTQRLPDMSCSTVFGVQLDGSKERDILGIEEHIPYGGGLFVNFEWVTGENEALGDDPGGIRVEEGAGGDKVGRYS